MIKNFQRGESITEVLIALFMIVIVSTTIAGSVVSGLKNTALNRDRLVAENLAREGFEGIVNIRDTNWLRFSEDPENCFNIAPSKNLCDNASKIAPTAYAIRINPQTLRWNIKSADSALDLTLGEAANESFRISLIDRDSDTDSDNDTNEENDRDLYAHADAGSTIVEKSKFFRAVKIEYDEVAWQNSVQMKVTSKVEWLEAGNVRRVETYDIISNKIFE